MGSGWKDGARAPERQARFIMQMNESKRETHRNF